MVADGQDCRIQSEKRRGWSKMVGLALGKVVVGRRWSLMVEGCGKWLLMVGYDPRTMDMLMEGDGGRWVQGLA